MLLRQYPPLTFLFTGFSWLALASILGLASLVGMVQGTPLPPWVRTLHVHAVLIGGVVQILLGGFLLLIPPLHSIDRKITDSHPITFWTMNSGVVGMLIGFWLNQHVVIGIAGFVIVAAFLSIIFTVWTRASRAWKFSIKGSWHYALSFLCLVSGSACGEIMALGLIPESHGYIRLAHIHLVVLGFVVMAIVGIMQYVLPRVWNSPLSAPQLVPVVMTLMSVGMAGLIGGFLKSSVPIEMAAGATLVIGTILFSGNLFRTWLSSTHHNSAASDHLLIGTFFLLFTMVLGILVGANNLSSPPVLPYGKLHLTAYTHMAFVGFIVNAVMGAFSYLVPITLADGRISSAKKRAPYLDRLNRIMNRWSTVQISTLCLGTMGLGVLAALTWNVPLTSIYIRVVTWTCLGLLSTSFLLFSVKLTAIVAKKPDVVAAPQASPDELKLTA
jgi:hypothetical protein